MERNPDPAAVGAGALDSDVAAVAEAAREAGVPPWHALSVETARRVEDELFSSSAGPDVDLLRDLGIDGPGGDLPVRLYRPADGAVAGSGDEGDGGEGADDPPGAHGAGYPVVVFYHGGGWVLGTLDSADDLCRGLADRVGALVVSVDYRLAPEHPFPAAVEDAHAALQWAARYAPDLGGDPDRIAVAGTSAGGGLAAATAMRAARGGPDLSGQALLYPMLDYGDDHDSYRDLSDPPLLTRADVRWFWDLYLRSPVDADHPFAAPAVAREELIRGTPPAVVATAGYDVLRDEAAAYADRLRAVGTGVEHLHCPTLAHGFLSTADVSGAADRAFDAVASALRGRLGRPDP